MEIVSLLILVVDFICTLVLVFCIHHVLRWALVRVSEWRWSIGKRSWSSGLCFVLALLAALSFVL